MPSIRFYFDYESPNAYLAWTQLPKLASRYGFTVEDEPQQQEVGVQSYARRSGRHTHGRERRGSRRHVGRQRPRHPSS
jgi:2-hydroxychromene-2-carboxylate isomerase